MTSTQEISSSDRTTSSACDDSPFPYHPNIAQEIARLRDYPSIGSSSQIVYLSDPRWINGNDLRGHPSSKEHHIEWPERIMNYEDEELQEQIKWEEEKTPVPVDYNYWLDKGAPQRVCSDCNTTKTPLWRSGPQGPKSLCNACGIRLRKARKANDGLAGVIPVVPPSRGRKKKSPPRDPLVPLKKRWALEELSVALDKRPVCHSLLPQDEREAALLLMALSSGLIRG